MKILLVNDYATPTYGAELGTLELREGLRERGHDARIFASSAGTDRCAGFADYECLGTTSRFRTLLQAANPWAALRLRRVLAEFRPDVVHVRMFLTQLSPLILPVLAGVPALYHVVWYRPICPRGTKMLPDGSACEVAAGLACYQNQCVPLHHWLPLMAQMRFWRNRRHVFARIVANSEAVRRSLVANGIEPVEVIPNGIPVRPPRKSLARDPQLVFAGRLAPEKGVDVLLHAFTRVVRQIPQTTLLLIGDGPEAGRLQSLSAELGLGSSVTFRGEIPQTDLEDDCSGAWAQIAPSRWAEPFGKVAAEAMMRGTAVIASKTGGLAEIVRDGRTGYLVSPGDVAELAEAMLRLLRDRDLAERLGAAGRERALSRYSQSSYLDRFIVLYHDLCQTTATTHAVNARTEGGYV